MLKKSIWDISTSIGQLHRFKNNSYSNLLAFLILNEERYNRNNTCGKILQSNRRDLTIFSPWFPALFMPKRFISISLSLMFSSNNDFRRISSRFYSYVWPLLEFRLGVPGIFEQNLRTERLLPARKCSFKCTLHPSSLVSRYLFYNIPLPTTVPYWLHTTWRNWLFLFAGDAGPTYLAWDKISSVWLYMYCLHGRVICIFIRN